MSFKELYCCDNCQKTAPANLRVRGDIKGWIHAAIDDGGDQVIDDPASDVQYDFCSDSCAAVYFTARMLGTTKHADPGTPQPVYIDARTPVPTVRTGDDSWGRRGGVIKSNLHLHNDDAISGIPGVQSAEIIAHEED